MKREKDPKESKRTGYTVTEVGTLLESLRQDIKVVAEGHGGLDKRLESLEIEVHGNSRRLDMLALTAGVTKDKVSRVEDAVSKLGKDLGETKVELKKEILELGNRLTAVETHR